MVSPDDGPRARRGAFPSVGDGRRLARRTNARRPRAARDTAAAKRDGGRLRPEGGRRDRPPAGRSPADRGRRRQSADMSLRLRHPSADRRAARPLRRCRFSGTASRPRPRAVPRRGERPALAAPRGSGAGESLVAPGCLVGPPTAGGGVRGRGGRRQRCPPGRTGGAGPVARDDGTSARPGGRTCRDGRERAGVPVGPGPAGGAAALAGRERPGDRVRVGGGPMRATRRCRGDGRDVGRLGGVRSRIFQRRRRDGLDDARLEALVGGDGRGGPFRAALRRREGVGGAEGRSGGEAGGNVRSEAKRRA